MKNKLLLLALLLPWYSYGQTKARFIKGTVLGRNMQALPGVNISLEGSYDGGTSDSSGQFSFETSDTSTMLIFEKADYEALYMEIESKGDVEVQVKMKQAFTELNAVSVSAGVLSQKQISVLNPIDVVTVAGSAGDISGALKTLPGTQQINDREGLFVRGGTGDETQQFIDGAMVRNAFLTGLPNLGTRGRFSPFLFKGTVFSPGGYSAQYGGALSGAVMLQSIDLPERTSASLNLSALGAGGGYQHLSEDQTFSIGASYNYTNLGLYFKIVPQLLDYENAPVYHSGDFNIRKKLGKGMLKFYTYGSLGRVGIYRPYLDSYTDSAGYLLKTGTRLQNNNLYTNLSYSTYFNKGWDLSAVVSYSTNTDSFGAYSTPYAQTDFGDIVSGVKNLNHFGTGRIKVGKSVTPKLDLTMGLETQISKERFDSRYYPTQSVSEQSFEDMYSAAFFESEFYANNDLGIKAGLRYEYSDLLQKSNIAPRISVGYRLGKLGELSAAYGHYYQKPNPQFLYNSTDFEYQKATHYVATFTKSMKDRLLRVEGFYKGYDELITYQSDQYGFQFYAPPLSGLSQLGDGYAQGIELYYRDKKSIKGIDFWVSYSYLDTRRKFLNFPVSVQPDFAAQHTGALVVKKFWVKYNFGINASYNFASGRPYFDPNTDLDAQGQVRADHFMQNQSPVYGSLSLSANYLREFGNVFSVFVLSVSNVLNQTQIYGYNFATTPDAQGYYRSAPVLPGARRFVFLGAFFSLGIDRSQEAINNNL